MSRGLSWKNFDFLLLGAVVLASSFGTVMIRSVVAGNEVLQPLISRQVYFAILGVVLIFLLAYLPIGPVDAYGSLGRWLLNRNSPAALNAPQPSFWATLSLRLIQVHLAAFIAMMGGGF